VLTERGLKVVGEDRDNSFVVDIVGIGGDGRNTFNVSTTSAIASTSRLEQSVYLVADLLPSLGCLFTPPNAETLYPSSLHRPILQRPPMCNVLGPLIDPHRRRRTRDRPYIRSVIARWRCASCMAPRGLGAISCAGETHAWDKMVRSQRLRPGHSTPAVGRCWCESCADIQSVAYFK
jgi:hypothetical protein